MFNNFHIIKLNGEGYLQDLVYKLSKVGQAIEKNDLSAASSVLGQNTDADWVQKVNSALNKVVFFPFKHIFSFTLSMCTEYFALLQFSGSDEEKSEIDSFNSSLSSLVSSGNVFLDTPNMTMVATCLIFSLPLSQTRTF